MPGLVGNPPGIFSPGIGPNGPGPIDFRRALADVGTGSVPYGSTFGFAASNTGRTGFIGPAAGSLQLPTTWYVRTGGSNNNGGTSTSLAPDRSGSDGVTNNTTTFTSATAAFTSADVGKGICINTGANARHHRIASVTNATTVILDRVSSNASSLAWAIGGAWADPRVPMGDVAVNADTNSPVRSGDTVYVGAGTYRAIIVTGVTPAFNGVVAIIGDVTGQFTGDAGMVQITAFTTSDKAAPSASPLLALSSRSNFTFQYIMFVAGTGNPTAINTLVATPSQNISLIDCVVHALANVANGAITISAIAGGQYLNWLIDRCIVFGKSNSFAITSAQASVGSGSVNLGYVIQNSLLIAGLATSNGAVLITGTASTGRQPGGGIIRNCTMIGGGQSSVLQVQNAAYSAALPVTVLGCLIVGGTGLNANTSGQIVENYNEISSGTPRTNVATGAQSDTNVNAILFHFGQERIWLPPLFRPFGEPMAGSPLLGFGMDGSQSPYDLRGPNNPRPAGGSSFAPAVGALERADTFVADPAPIGGGGSPVKLTGPGYNDFLLPIQAGEVGVARTVSVKVKFDASYAGTLPQIEMIARPQQGVVGQIVTAVGTAGNVITITLASFTPTAVGVLNIRLLSLDLSGASVVEWDDFAVA